MAKYQGVKEKLHFPIYDAFLVKGGENAENKGAQKFMEAMNDPRMIRFFVDVQNKTKLETNLQSSGVLPSQNTLEVRAMRVVVGPTSLNNSKDTISQIVEDYAKKAEEESNVDKLKAAIKSQKSSLVDDIKKECIRICSEENTALSEIIYNSVTTLLVGEKIMIEAPTWYFPGGAGVHPGSGRMSNHGEPDPMATFRFAEPVMIEPQQNFRVEMLFPRGVSKQLAEIKGPFTVWVVLDGYLVRDVQ